MAAYQDDREILEKLRQGKPLTEQERRQLMQLSSRGQLAQPSAGTDFASKDYDPGQPKGLIDDQMGGDAPPDRQPSGGLIGGQTDSITGTKMGQSTPVGTDDPTDTDFSFADVDKVISLGRRALSFTPVAPVVATLGLAYDAVKWGIDAFTKEDTPPERAKKEQAQKAKEESSFDDRMESAREAMGKADSANTGMHSQGGFEGLGIGNPSSYGGKSLGDAAAGEMGGGDGKGGDDGGAPGRDSDSAGAGPGGHGSGGHGL